MLATLLVASLVGATPHPALRVCADPNGLPYSNERGEGFENALAELIAAELQRPLTYTWRAQRRDTLRQSLEAGRCDLLIGVPLGAEGVRTTQPYYRSRFAFVARRDAGPMVRNFDDHRLARMRIGIQLVGHDGDSATPAFALARRHLTKNVVGFTLLGEHAPAAPLGTIIEALRHRQIDVAIVWGPVAGFFAQRASHDLVMTPLAGGYDDGLPLFMDIAMAVQADDAVLADQLDAALARRRSEVTGLLERFGIPWEEPSPP